MRILFKSSLLFIFIITSGPLSAQQIQSPKTDVYQDGVILFEKGFFEESLNKLTQFKKNNTNSELSIFVDYYIARSKTGIDSTGIEYYYQSFIRDYPKHDLSKILLKDLGHRFSKNGNYEDAITYYQESLKTYNSIATAAETEYWVAEAAVEKEIILRQEDTFWP